MTFRVLICDHVDPAAVEILEQAQGITVSGTGPLTRGEVLAAAPNADALLVRSSTTVDAEIMAAAPHLRAVARAGVGVDNVDLADATQRGIVVMNTPGGNTTATAEHTFALMLALARHIPAAHQSMLEGRWDRKLYKGLELAGKTLGIIGFGRVGQAVARRAIAFEMVVITHDPRDPERKAREAAEIGAKMVPLDDLLQQADIVTLHPALNAETRGMIDADVLAHMKKGALLINAARGALVDAAALADALASGQIAGAALDVYADEPPAPDMPLVGLPNVIHTPHLAASTSDAQRAVAVQAAYQLRDALLAGEYRNVVNPDVLPVRAAFD